MICSKIEITGQEDLSIEVPESWKDVTFNQFHLISKEEDVLKRISILTNIPYEMFNKYPELADFYVWVENKLSWSTNWDETSSSSVNFIMGDKGVFNFPEDIGVLSIGLYKDLQKEAQDNNDDVYSIYPLICASYYQTITDGDYDYTKAMELAKVFNEQPCAKVYQAAGFFLKRLNELRNGTY